MYCICSQAMETNLFCPLCISAILLNVMEGKNFEQLI